jgi:putative acetyltransferase
LEFEFAACANMLCLGLTHAMLRIVSAETKETLEQASVLFREYAASLGVDLSFQNFDRELATLPGDYTPPSGRLFLAAFDEADSSATNAEAESARPLSSISPASSAWSASLTLAGCVALRKFDDEVCEMKRLYVKPQFRGHGLGLHLAKAVIEAARQVGYRSMRLDTLPQMTQAQALYRALGFREIPPYRHNPVVGTLYFELEL